MRQILFLFLAFPFLCIAQIPEYYSEIDFSQDGEYLKEQLAELVTETHTTNLSYTPGVWNALKISDLDPDNSQNVLLVYGHNDDDGIHSTDRTRDKDLSCHTSSCTGLWNREHVFPRSLGTPNLGTTNAGADVHSLRAIDAQRNIIRSNRPFEAGSGAASYITNSGNFFPGDEWRGEVARMMMYMYIRYPTQCAATSVGAGSTSFSPLGDMPDIFLIWNAEDPVTDFEMQRNDHIETVQGNRNPFIDNPFLATMIWSGPVAEDSWEVLYTETQTATPVFVYPTVTDDCVYIHNYYETNSNITIISLKGQRFELNAENNKLCLDGFSSGMYFISLMDETNQQVFKVVKR
jgi:endonuclease I